MRPIFSWLAIYNDGTELSQLNPDGSENSYQDIDRKKLVKFQLINNITGLAHVTLHLRKGQQLIHRRRHFIRLNVGSIFAGKPDDGREDETVWILGFQENRRGVNVQLLLFVFQDGSIEFVDRWKPGHALYGEIKLLDEEKLISNGKGIH